MNEVSFKTRQPSHANVHAIVSRVCTLAVLLSLVINFAPGSFSVALPQPTTPSPLVSTATRAGRLAVFDDAWSTINQRYYDSAFRGLDWVAQGTRFRALAAQANSSEELYAVLRRMIAPLADPHTRVFAPEEKFDWWEPKFVSIGLGVKEIDGLPTVVQIEPNSAPARAGIRPGDVIDSVNGQPAALVVNQRFTNVTPTKAERTRAFASVFNGPAGTSLELGWKNQHERQKHARFDRYWQQRVLGLRVDRVNGNYLVIEIDAFTKPIALSFARIVKEKLKGTRGVIIDLRNNGGGDAEAMAEIASTFLGSGVDLGEFTDRSGAGFSVSTSFLTAESLGTHVPLVVLTSERTSSAAEIFVAALKRAKRAPVIGTQTCGCVLAIRARHILPDGGVLDVSELDFKTPAGERLEGNGIQPDETVMVHRENLYAKQDAALLNAIVLLKRSLSRDPK